MSEVGETPTKAQSKQTAEVNSEAYVQARQVLSREVIPVVIDNPKPAPVHLIDQKFEDVAKHNLSTNQDKTKSQPSPIGRPSERISSNINFQDELNPLM